ncbi:MAG: ABC transporter transmembrane domain-containing protein [Micrococcales bacterium]
MVALAVLSMAFTVGFSYLLSGFIAGVFAGGRNAHTDVLVLVGVLLLGLGRAALIWVQEWLASMAAARAKTQLRGALLAALEKLGPEWLAKRHSSSVALLATTKLDALDAYFAKFLPQLVYTALITPVLTALIWGSDLWSGVAVVCTLPLIPLFMIFIGWATQTAQQRQLASVTALWQHFGEVLRGLTTLRVFGRLPRQPQAILAASEGYRRRTMKVLRLSFLSGFALEVAASLSVALVAVSIGIRLIDGTLSLETGLFVLLLAPEAYLPLRMVGANFHASSEGVAVSGQVLDVIDEAAAAVSGAVDAATVSAPMDLSWSPGGVVTQLSGQLLMHLVLR